MSEPTRILTWRALRNTTLLLMLAACCLACAPETEAERDQNKRRFPPGFKIENYRWNGTVVEGGLIEARNPYGDVRSRTTTFANNSVEVSAQIQKLAPDQPEVEFVIKESEQGLIVTVGKAAFEMTELGDGPDDGFPGRIDLTILVPQNSRLKAQTVDDDIVIDGTGMSSDVEAISRNGNIKVVTYGQVRATTGKGAVDVMLGGKSWTRPHELTTTTGKIVVDMLDFANLAVDAQTTGEIRTKFPAGLSPEVTREKGAASFALNQGNSDLTVRSESGIVELNVVKKLDAKL